MSANRKFEDLKAWQRARDLLRDVYRLTRKVKFRTDYSLCNQIRRASLSAVSNIAEGFEREGDKEFIQFLSQAKGSCGEERSQLYVAYDLGYINEEEFESSSQIAIETSRIISGLIKYFKESKHKGSKFK